ncbi:MAG TPA: hypothetical protein VK991_08995 [Halomonas sp.]|nr:hypothetical protein [Halomonas sp.]
MNTSMRNRRRPRLPPRGLASRLALLAALSTMPLAVQATEQEEEGEGKEGAAQENPAYFYQGAYLTSIGESLRLLGDSVTSLDGLTSGFRLTAGFTPYELPLLDIGAEIDYRESEEVPLVASQGDSQLVDTTSLGGSLLAGLRLGNFGVYAKSGFASWQGVAVTGQPGVNLDGGMTRVNGFGAHLAVSGVVGRLQYERFDEPSLEHLNHVTASIHLPF